MRYLITGGTGFIGTNFIKKLSLENDFVTILSRKKSDFKKNCKFINDLSLIENNEKIDCIINLAGKPIDCRWTKSNKKELVNSRVSITKSLVELVERLDEKPKVMISASAIGFYGGYDNEVLDESSVGKHSFTYELCQQWENEALKLKKYDVRVCIMRLGVVIGKNGGFIKKVSLPFRLGLGGKLGNGRQTFSWIHIDDVVSAMKFIIENEKCVGIYNLVAPEATTNESITNYLGKILNRPIILNMPTFLVKIIFGEMGRELLLKGNKIIPKRLLEQGYKFQYNDIKPALSDIFNNLH